MENKKTNKKGMAYIVGKKPTYFIIALFILTLIFIIYGFAISGIASSLASYPEETEIDVIVSRFFNSPECFAYHDEDAGITYMGVIDLNKFKDENLNFCYPVGNSDVRSFRLLLKSPELELEKTIETKNFLGGKTTMIYPVVIYYKGDFNKGELFVSTKKWKSKNI